MKSLSCLVLIFIIFTSQAAIITVNQSDDLQDAVDGGCDLREAVMAANFNVAVDTCVAGDSNSNDIIIIDVAGPIQLTNEIDVLSGMYISSALGSPNLVKIIADVNERIFEVHPTTANSNDFEMNKLHLVGGDAGMGDGGAIVFYRYQNVNLGNILITNSVFENNTGSSGGAVAFDNSRASKVTMLNNDFINNEAGDGIGGAISAETATDGEFIMNFNLFKYNSSSESGGGAFVFDAGGIPFKFKNNRFYENISGSNGGALALWGSNAVQEYILEGNAFVANTAATYGGAISASPLSRLWIYNSVMSQNLAANGGAMASIDATVYLRYSTLAHNEAPVGSNYYAYSGSLGSLSASIIAYPIGGSNCAGPGNTLTTAYNIYDDTSCPYNGGNDTQTDPKLAGISFNDNDFPALVPTSDSPAIDSLSDFICKNHEQNQLAVDAQGNPRPVDGTGDNQALCDKGAIEVPESHDLIWSDGFGS